MCKTSLRVEQMNPAAFVDHTVELNRRLVNGECRGPGDLENAMRRVEMKWGIPFSVSWALRYRKPKTVAADIYARHLQAVETHREIQLNRLQHERSITEAKGWFTSALVSAADFVGGKDDGGS